MSYNGKDAVTLAPIHEERYIVAIPTIYTPVSTERALHAIVSPWKFSGLPLFTVYADYGNAHDLPDEDDRHTWMIRRDTYDILIERGIESALQRQDDKWFSDEILSSVRIVERGISLTEMARRIIEAQKKYAESLLPVVGEDALKYVLVSSALREALFIGSTGSYYDNFVEFSFFTDTVHSIILGQADVETVEKFLALHLLILGLRSIDEAIVMPGLAIGSQGSNRVRFNLESAITQFIVDGGTREEILELLPN